MGDSEFGPPPQKHFAAGDVDAPGKPPQREPMGSYLTRDGVYTSISIYKVGQSSLGLVEPPRSMAPVVVGASRSNAD